MSEKLVNISAHIPADLAKKLITISKFEERSKSYYIKKGLEEFLKERLQDMKDYQSAKQTLKEAKAKNDFIGFDEVFKSLKK